MSVLFGKSFENVNSNYNKKNLFGFLTLILLINLLPYTLYGLFINKAGYYIVLAILWFILFCIHVTAQHYAVHKKEGVFPDFKDIYNNAGLYLKNGLCLTVFVIIQYVIVFGLLLLFNYFLAKSMGFNGNFQEVMISLRTNLYQSIHAGIYSLLFKEICINFLIMLFMYFLFIGNYANFIYDLKFTSLFNFKRGMNFMLKAKGDTFALMLKTILFYIAVAVFLMICILVLAFITGIIIAFASHGVRPIINPEDFLWLRIGSTVVFTYILGFLGIYIFDMVAQYIRTNKELQLEEQESDN